MMWLLDLIPWWAWLAALATIAAFTYPLWSAIWFGLPRATQGALIAISGAFAAFLFGRSKGRDSEIQRQMQRDAKAEGKRQEIDDDVRKMDRPARDRELDKWMRD